MTMDEGAAPPNQPRPVVGLGELIWDILPEGRRLGGAPSNFAYVSRLLGAEAAVATRIGRDALGAEAVEKLERAGVSTRFVQVDEEHPTGTVGCVIGEGGEAHFNVNQNSAWDYLEWTDEWARLAASTDVVCFGTLGQRHPAARATVQRFLEATRADALRLFDVNLRHSFFTPEMLSRSLSHATVVKLNEEELAAAAGMLSLSASGARATAEALMSRFPVMLVAVTRGARGSLLVSRAGGADEHAGFRTPVVDTIGCGDAFAATLALCLRRGATLAFSNEVANRVGAWVATQPGGTPEADPATIARLLEGLE